MDLWITIRAVDGVRGWLDVCEARAAGGRGEGGLRRDRRAGEVVRWRRMVGGHPLSEPAGGLWRGWVK